jgi:HAD superfamily hydrolase (TIGR01509 family)
VFDAVIFDCDGVLVDSEIIAVEAETAALAEIGLRYDLAEFKVRFMGLSDDSFFAALDRDAKERLGKSLPPDFREKVNARKHLLFSEELVEVTGARACIERIRRPKAVASSGTAIGISVKLHKTGLWDLFSPHIYSAEDVTHAKPAPDLFLHAAQMLGVLPARCLVLEDSVNGIKAAGAAGMAAWGFAGGRHVDSGTIARLKDAGARRIVSDWEQAGSILCAATP